MEWLDHLAAALPAPREDEPPDLRRKIVAELRDHLQSAIQRELLLTGDAEQAQQNVLARFGDPARLARKLWFDAMWGKIMSQRLMLVALVVVVLASLGSFGLTWFLVDQARQVNQALVEQNRATNELILAKLAALGNAAGSAEKSMEWNSLQVQLSVEKSGGAPAAGFEVRLVGHLLDTAKDMTLVRTTRPDGVADFGLVRPGAHSVYIKTPWGESNDYGGSMKNYGRSITVLPGEPQTVEIVCPPILEETDVTIAVDWPNDLAGRGLWLVCDFVRPPRQINDQSWTRNADNGRQYVAVEASGKLINFCERMIPSIFFNAGMSSSVADRPGIYSLANVGPPVPYIWLPATAPESRLRWPVGIYRVGHFAVARESETRDDALPDDMLHPVFLGGIAIGTGDDNKGAVGLLDRDWQRAFIRRQDRRAVKIDIPKFEAVAGRLNEWRLSLPGPLVQLLKESRAVGPLNVPVLRD